MESENTTCGEPPFSSCAGAMPDPLTRGPLPRIRSHRGLRTGRMVARVPRELGRSCQFFEDYRHWSNRYNKLRDDPTAQRLGPCRDESQTIRGIAKRRKRSEA